MAASAPYTGLLPGTAQAAHLCLEAGCYTFTMSDSYGDGLSCDNGAGSYTVTNPLLGVVASGGAFGYGESTSFCVDLATEVVITRPVASLNVRTLDAEGRYALDLPGEAGPFELEVRDATGRAVLLTASLPDLRDQCVDLSEAATGVYLVQVRWPNGQRSARLFKH